MTNPHGTPEREVLGRNLRGGGPSYGTELVWRDQLKKLTDLDLIRLLDQSWETLRPNNPTLLPETGVVKERSDG